MDELKFADEEVLNVMRLARMMQLAWVMEVDARGDPVLPCVRDPVLAPPMC